MLPAPSSAIPVGFTSPVKGIAVELAPAETWLLGILSTRAPLSVTYMSPLGSKANPAGELKAQEVTVASQGDREYWVALVAPPLPFSTTCSTWFVMPSPMNRFEPVLSTASACG